VLNIHAEYDRDTSPVKLTDISRQLSPGFATRCHCWYCWQHCVTVYEIITGGTLNVLNHIQWYASCISLRIPALDTCQLYFKLRACRFLSHSFQRTVHSYRAVDGAVKYPDNKMKYKETGVIIIISGSTVLVTTLAASHGRFRNLF
jgi:hypothetical protein